MNKTITLFFNVALVTMLSISAFGQADDITSGSDNLVVHPVADRTVNYDVSDDGVAKPILWGLDLAWLDEANIIKGINFMGKETVDIIRSSHMPTQPLVNDNALQGDALTNTHKRINIIKRNFGEGMNVGLNCDHPSVHSYFYGNAVNWSNLIEVTAKMHEDAGLNVITVAPFNEPDFSQTGQGTIQHFYDIITELRKRSYFDNIRISGGNTLNNDEALGWYNYLDPAGLDEGNTHQLAGIFDTYANFFQQVRANGDHATADELHNVMEAMVGVEYGMQTGIWWYTAEYARGEFCKASRPGGARLGYAEHRPNWTAASVYRAPDGKIQAFGGTSERQAATTSYRFVSLDRDVFYEGHGPQREYTMELPGGTGYQQGQTNAERVVNITWGKDVQPVIDGTYVIVNRNSKKVMEVSFGSKTSGANIDQRTYNKAFPYQHWEVNPVDERIGGDFSYFKLKNVHSAKVPDVVNWSFDNGANIHQWDDAGGGNQQWYLEYVEDGWFYIRSRHSALCLEIANASNAELANVQQWEVNGGDHQQWRFIPVGAEVEFDAPASPADVRATAQSSSVRLDWGKSPETDVNGYSILRAESILGPFYLIARDVTTTSYVDNTTMPGQKYYYAIQAVDESLNTSLQSKAVSAEVTNENDMIAHLQFEGNTRDSSINLNHSAAAGSLSFTDGKIGSKAAQFNGSDVYLKLPSTIADHSEMTISAWVYCLPAQGNQHIFDFGFDTEHSVYLCPNTSLINGKLRFMMKNGDVEESLQTTRLPFNEWKHVAITLGEGSARMYVDGELVDESDEFTMSPMDAITVVNYLGRSQNNEHPLFKGNLDDFIVFNYALSAEEIMKLADPTTSIDETEMDAGSFSMYPVPASNVLNVSVNKKGNPSDVALVIFDMNGKQVLNVNLPMNETTLDVSDLASGIYMVRFSMDEKSIHKKLIIRK